MYVKVTNNQPSKFPYTLADLRRDNPGTSFPADITNELLASFNVYPVAATPAPEFDSKTHRAKQGVELVDSAWTQVWHLQELPEPQASANIRASRNQRLAACDWTQLPDAPVDHIKWATYRQALRDVSSQPGFPWNVEWPSQPA
jgi:hypothetical protein